jgi:hypothetical protein
MITLPKWEKRGLIYSCEGRNFFSSHATRPIPFLVDENCLRIYFSSRCVDDIPYPTYIDVNPNDPNEILHINEVPLLQLGRSGTFDDSGITPVSILRGKSQNFLYYVGWKRRRVNVTIETSIGVATLDTQSGQLNKIFEGPILAQDPSHPILVAAPFVVAENEAFQMWYCSGTEWRDMPHGPEMLYTIYHGRSDDAFRWQQSSSRPVIPYAYDGEVVSAPWVIKLNSGYLMWYSTRGSNSPVSKNYSIGMASSEDGLNWTRIDQSAGIEKSSSGWDSEMICYPAVFNHGDDTFMFYSGNGVGIGGIGFAVADQKLPIIDW